MIRNLYISYLKLALLKIYIRLVVLMRASRAVS